MIIHALRDAVIAALKSALPEASVSGHGGTFTEDELKRYAARTPALFVSVSDVSAIGFQGSAALGDVGMGIALLVGPGKKGQPADAVALAMLPVVLRTIAGQRWGLPDVEGKPDGLQAQNLYSAQLDAGYIALWGISWRQHVALGAGLRSKDELVALDDFLTVQLTQESKDGAVLAEETFTVRTNEEHHE